MTRRFLAMDEGRFGNIHWRVVEGRKSEDDLRLDLLVPRWTAVPMGLGFLFADFFYENENVLYPPSRYRGGQMYLDFCGGAAHLGWEHARQLLAEQRLAKTVAA